MKTAPERYRVTLRTENTRLNAKVYIYLMYIEGAPELHKVDDATHFSAAQFAYPFYD